MSERVKNDDENVEKRRHELFKAVGIVGGYLRWIVTTLRPRFGLVYFGQVLFVAYFEQQRHASLGVKVNMAVHEPVAWILSIKSKYRVSTRRYGDRIFQRWHLQIAFELALFIHAFNVLNMCRFTQLI